MPFCLLDSQTCHQQHAYKAQIQPIGYASGWHFGTDRYSPRAVIIMSTTSASQAARALPHKHSVINQVGHSLPPLPKWLVALFHNNCESSASSRQAQGQLLKEVHFPCMLDAQYSVSLGMHPHLMVAGLQISKHDEIIWLEILGHICQTFIREAAVLITKMSILWGGTPMTVLAATGCNVRKRV